jgi:hypothetical protein
MNQETLKRNLRYLIADSSVEEVYNTLAQIFKDDYAFLHKFHSKVEPVKKITTVIDAPSFIPAGFTQGVTLVSNIPHVASVAPLFTTAAVVSQEAVVQEAPKIRADTRVRIVKKPASPDDLPKAPVAPAPAPAATKAKTPTQPLTQTQVPSIPIVTSPAVQSIVHAQSGLRDPKDIKKWQKEEEEKKAEEHRVAGINPISLLTEANMRKWVVDEKKTFAAIAREYVGISDAVIASEAKKYGIQGDIAKRRAAILVAKKGK